MSLFEVPLEKMHPLYKENQKTLLGRAKNSALQKISKSTEEFPSYREVFQDIFKAWKKNSDWGRFYFHLLWRVRYDKIEFPVRFSRKETLNILAQLDTEECYSEIYCEGRLHGAEGNPYYGCLILGHRRPSGGPGYYAIVFREAGLERLEFISVVPNSSGQRGRISRLTTDGWFECEPNKVSQFASLRVVFATFRSHLKRHETRRIPIEDVRVDPAFNGPDDPEVMRRLQSAFLGEMAVSTGLVSISLIEPFSVDFCLSLSSKISLYESQRIRQGYRPKILVYWNGSKFIMSDDYPTFLSYKKANCGLVSVSILGDFPKHFVEIDKTGGIELIPPLGISPISSSNEEMSKDFKIWQLEEKIRTENQENLPGHLIAVWMSFADLLANTTLDEREIHRFLVRFPEVLTVYGTRIDSEIWLGSDYRVDLVVRSSGVREETTLVELENHKHQIFTNSGQTRAEITHAIHQVQDWFRWIRKNPRHKFSESLGDLPPKGLVIAGRSNGLSEDQRKRLAHLNVSSPVQLITYDELLDKFADMILGRIDNVRH